MSVIETQRMDSFRRSMAAIDADADPVTVSVLAMTANFILEDNARRRQVSSAADIASHMKRIMLASGVSEADIPDAATLSRAGLAAFEAQIIHDHKGLLEQPGARFMVGEWIAGMARSTLHLVKAPFIAVGNVLDHAQMTVARFFGRVSDAGRSIAHGLRTAISDGLRAVASVLNRAADRVAGFAHNEVQGARDMLTTVQDGMREMADQVRRDARNAVELAQALREDAVRSVTAGTAVVHDGVTAVRDGVTAGATAARSGTLKAAGTTLGLGARGLSALSDRLNGAAEVITASARVVPLRQTPTLAPVNSIGSSSVESVTLPDVDAAPSAVPVENQPHRGFSAHDVGMEF